MATLVADALFQMVNVVLVLVGKFTQVQVGLLDFQLPNKHGVQVVGEQETALLVGAYPVFAEDTLAVLLLGILHNPFQFPDELLLVAPHNVADSHFILAAANQLAEIAGNLAIRDTGGQEFEHYAQTEKYDCDNGNVVVYVFLLNGDSRHRTLY